MQAISAHFRRGPTRGFTMVELMVVLAIAAILLGMAVPSFSDLIKQQKLTAASNDLVAAIHLTRSEALKRGARVDLVAVDADWSKGWIVFVDENDNQQVDADDQKIFIRGAFSDGMTVESKLSDNSTKYLAFNGSGRTRTNSSPVQPQWGSFRLRLDGGKRNVVINMLGRPRVCTPGGDSETC